jgi:hypothetical protein
MNTDNLLFKSKVVIPRRFSPFLFIVAMNSFILLIDKSYILAAIFFGFIAFIFIYGNLTNNFSHEIAAYDTFFTLKQGKSKREIFYDKVDSIKFNKRFTGSMLEFFLKDSENSAIPIEMIQKLKKDKDPDYFIIPVDEVQKFKIFKKIISEKIEPARIDWGK